MGIGQWRADRANVRQLRAEWEELSVGLTEDEAYADPEWLEGKDRFDQADDALPWWLRSGI